MGFPYPKTNWRQSAGVILHVLVAGFHYAVFLRRNVETKRMFTDRPTN